MEDGGQEALKLGLPALGFAYSPNPAPLMVDTLLGYPGTKGDEKAQVVRRMSAQVTQVTDLGHTPPSS
jgi:hypothetical protein